MTMLHAFATSSASCVKKSISGLFLKQKFIRVAFSVARDNFTSTGHSMDEYKNVKTVYECVKQLASMFKQNQVSEPEQSAKLIVAHVLGEETLAKIRGLQSLTQQQLLSIKLLSAQRLRHHPVQYVLGNWCFCHLTLTMKEPVFIPRPETEELVGYALDDASVKNAHHGLEIGPGSGAISIYLLDNIPHLEMTAFEASESACQLTYVNAVKYEVDDRLHLHNHHLSEDVGKVTCLLSMPVDFIISNPPYIPSEHIEKLQKEVVGFEDHLALDGGPDGLDIIQIILHLADVTLKPGGSIWLEVDSTHPEEIESMAPQYGLHYVRTIPDFMGIPRFCHLRREMLDS